jgi:diguanylate cyclase (GGDEF)-like protein
MRVKTIFASAIKYAGLVYTSDDLAREQFRALSKLIPVMYLILLINSLFMAFAVWEGAGALLTFSFPAIAAPLMVFRLIMWRKRALDNRELPIAAVRKILLGNVTAAVVMAILLGSWAVAIMFAAPVEYYAYIPLFTILSMITCSYCLKALPAATYAVIITGTFYIVAGMLMTGDSMMLSMAGNMTVITGLIVYMIALEFNQLRHLIESRTKMIEQRSVAEHLANRDPLTDMPNRRAFLDALYQRQRTAPDVQVAVVMVDMNGFKPINDTYGHAAGDQILVSMGKCLTAIVGKSGIVARLGGDEFAVLFTCNKDAAWVYQCVERMVHEIHKPVILGQHEVRMGAAFGIAHELCIPADPMVLIQQADIALYEAKSRKSTAISIFEGQMAERVRRRTMIEQALSDEQQMAQIELHFQPIFELRSGTHVGFEALARWHHPQLGTISPVEFVESAERSGLATKLTVHLFRCAILTALKWDKDKRLSFNISGSGLGTSNLDKIIPDILHELQFDPARLSIEVTETALLRDTATAQRILGRLQKLGIRIALDDFGAGYASVGYLQEMQFDDIKLDGSLIANIVGDQKSRDLLIGVLHLCSAVHADVTAEMVETPQQLALLRTLPIANVQGYLLGKPVPAYESFAADPGLAKMRMQLFTRS